MAPNQSKPQGDEATLRELEETKKQLAELQQSVANSKPPKKRKKQAKKDRPVREKAEADAIKQTVQRELWPKVKFITNDEMLTKATEKCFDAMDLVEKKGKKGADLKAIRTLWVQKWQEEVRFIYNEHRNFVQQSLHDKFRDAVLDGTHRTLWPTPDQLQNISVRNRDFFPADEQDGGHRHLHLFKMCWDVMLPSQG